MGFWAALQFLTIFPSPLRGTVSAEVSGQSLAYFSLIGLALGSILLGIWYGLAFILPPPVVYALLIITLAILTGAHHLDGLIDTFDGVMAGKDRGERLQTMADTKVGAFGIAAIILLLLLKYVALSSAPVVESLLLMPTLSRWAMVCVIFAFPYAKNVGMGLVFKQRATWQRLTAATAIALVTA
ncbi:MAG TPA: adenosylcobinamide-GDP ribazoletransferase, partial [Dehalococcoidia bacterium]|nr:adenosylcobinamide-GDP ribazoletransferase [Dehalococcoidia bacterium]